MRATTTGFEAVQTNELGQLLLDGYARLAAIPNPDDTEGYYVEDAVAELVKREGITKDTFMACDEATLAEIGREALGMHFRDDSDDGSAEYDEAKESLWDLMHSLAGRVAVIGTLDQTPSIRVLKDGYSKKDREGITKPFATVAQATGRIGATSYSWYQENSRLTLYPKQHYFVARKEIRAKMVDETGQPLVAIRVE